MIHKVMLGLALKNCNAKGFRFGSDWGYACPDAIQIKGSVCQSTEWIA